MLTLFNSILKSYLLPRSKTRKAGELLSIYTPIVAKIMLLFFLTATILVWMGINSGLEEEFRKFKENPYTTSIFVPAKRFEFAEKQLRQMEKISYHPESKFNFDGKGEIIFSGNYSFSSVYLIFYQNEEHGAETAGDSREIKIFRGRTISKEDKRALTGIQSNLETLKRQNYSLPKDWDENENGIIVSRDLLKRLGYPDNAKPDTIHINYSFQILDKEQGEEEDDENSFIPVPVKVLGIAHKMPFGHFIISNGFYYNYQQAGTFNPHERVEQFTLLTDPSNEKNLIAFLQNQFKFIETYVKISMNREDGQVMYRVDFKDESEVEETQYDALAEETRKYGIINKIGSKPFTCHEGFYKWKKWEKGMDIMQPDFLTLYLKEKYVEILPQVNHFLSDIGVEMDDSIVHVFQNYYKDVKRFKKISRVLYSLLIMLGILVSVVIYIKSVQASMHRLGVYNTFGVSSHFLSLILAVESILIYAVALAITLFSLWCIPSSTFGKTFILKPFDIFTVFILGSLLSFCAVYTTAKIILTKSPYSLFSYRG